MAKKENKSEFLQKQWDDKEVGVLYNIIWRQKGIDASIKGLLTYMCNDIGMNGSVTWKQSTYADKVGMSRQYVIDLFNKFEELRILIPDPSNKPGSKKNTYKLVLNFDALRKTNNGFKKGKKTCQPQLTEPVNPSCHNLSTPVDSTCQPEFTYKTNKTCIKHVLNRKDEDVLASSLSEPQRPEITDDDILALALNDI